MGMPGHMDNHPAVDSVLCCVFLPVSMFQSELDFGGLSEEVEWQFGVSGHTQGG